jgi:hypothetical protein
MKTLYFFNILKFKQLAINIFISKISYLVFRSIFYASGRNKIRRWEGGKSAMSFPVLFYNQ